MPKLSIVTHVYNNQASVLEQIERWSRIDPAFLQEIQFIIVDDCSTEPVVAPKSALNMRLFRIDTDIKWNQGGARNLAFFNALTEWALVFDLDQQLIPETVPLIVSNLDQLDSNTMYALRSTKYFNHIDKVYADHHINTFLVNVSRFKTHGMYDEDFSGHYGYEDVFMIHHWNRVGGNRALLGDISFFEEESKRNTQGLDRDLTRNQKLGAYKVALAEPNMQRLLRFQWREVLSG
jgi:glycosyltransferase involved in cell wall biosynthesis